MKTTEAKAIIAKAAKIVGGRVHTYSGRGMFGKNCLAIYCDDSMECIEEAAQLGLKGACIDSMGRGAVVYWPNIEP